MQKRPTLRVAEPSGPILGLAAIFAVSLIVGLLVGGVWTRFDRNGIREDDYIAMVSLIYTRDADLRGAEERLALVERDDIVKRVVSLAQEYPGSHPDAQAEARALRQLANAFERPTASRSPAQDTASRSGESFSPWTWLGLALVIICILGIGGPVALRLVHSTRQGLTGVRLSRPSNRSSTSRWRDGPNRGAPTLPLDADEGIDQFAQSGPQAQSGPPPQAGPTSRMAPSNPVARVVSSSPLARVQRAVVPQKQSTARFPSSRWHGATATFVSRYRHGVDPYDEVHPILSPLSGELIGACGMSALLKLADSADGRYYALSIWAQDYISDEPLRCVGLVSSYCKSHPPVELMRWAQSRVADEILVANPGLTLSLDTSNLKVEVNVLGLRYGIDVRGPDDSFFSELEVSFQVTVLAGAFPERSSI